MEFGVLGPLEVVEGDHRYTLGGPKQRAVLALLIAQVGKPVSVDTLIDGLYGDEASDRAHRSIHTFVSNLRSELGDIIERRGEGYILLVDRASIDAYRFEDELTAVGELDDPPLVAERLRAALSKWRGHPYADIEVYTTLTAEATRLNELRVAATELRIDAELESGRHTALIAELDALTIEYPLREHFWAQQMIALYRSGRQAEALRAYARARSTLVDQTGLDPSAELRHLEERILEQDPELHFEPRSSIRRAAILVVDVAESAILATMSPIDRDALIEQQTLAFTGAVTHHDGDVFAHRGSAMYAVFDDVSQATSAAAAAQAVLMSQEAPMRMALAAGDVEAQPGSEFVGPPLNRAAALVGAAHGGQILLSSEAHQALTEAGTAGWVIRSLGTHSFSGMDEPLMVQQLVVAGLPSEFPPLQMAALPPSLPGMAKGLPGYELREKIGSGVFGVVHRAYQPSVGREVAVKVIRSEFANHPDFIRRFEVEAQMVARLEHPHIVPLHDYWRDADGAFLVMRWVRGGSLADWLERGPLELFEVNAILAQIIPALDHAHRNGVLHRDLKPSNVLLDDDGNAYLTDFGIAVDVSRDDPAVDMRGIGSFIERCLAGVDVSPPIEEFLAQVRADSFADLVALLDSWAVVSGAEDLASDEIGFTATRNPYKGLSAFGEADAADFHGRDDEIAQLLGAIDQRKLVAVVGPSGIGKSSVVRAGLIPALRAGSLPGSDRWLITDMMPGAHPFEALATALHRVAIEPGIDIEQELHRDERGLIRAVRRTTPDGLPLVIVIDQFEELFTLTDDEAVQCQFLDLLMVAIADPREDILFVVTLRADFFDRPLRFGAFGDELRRATVPIASPTEDDLRAIISRPAGGVGISVAPALVERMIVDVKDQPGALPLLEFSLTELFLHRESDQLQVGSYESAGGVSGALGRRAEAIFLELDPSTQAVARQLFLRLVTLPDAERVTRRRVRQAELGRLGEAPAAIDTVLGAFGEHRLLITDRDPATRGPTVEVAHEAIFTEWDRLGRWIAERRSDLRARRRLLEAATDWEESGRQDALLVSGSRLGQMESFVATTDLSLGGTELDLVNDSGAKRERERVERRKVRRRVLVGFGAAAVIGAILSVVALQARNEAQNQELVAQSRELASQARLQIAEDPERAVLLAVEAIELGEQTGAQLIEGTDALHSALAQDRLLRRYEGNYFVNVDPSGTRFLTGSGSSATIVDIDTGEVLSTFEGDPGMEAVWGSFFNEGASIGVVFNDADGSVVRAWNVVDPLRPIYEVPGPDLADWAGGYVATKSGRPETGGVTVEIRDGSTGEPVWSETTFYGYMASDPSGEVVADVNAETSEMTLYRLATGEVISKFPVTVDPSFLAFSPESDRIAVLSWAESLVLVLDAKNGDILFSKPVDRPFAVAWTDDGTALIIVGNSADVVVIDAATGVDQLRLGGHQGYVETAAPVPGSGLVLTGGDANGEVFLWDVREGPVAEARSIPTGVQVTRILSYIGESDNVFVAGAGPAAGLVFDRNGTVLLEIEDVRDEFGELTSGVYGDNRYLAWVDSQGTGLVADLTTGDVVYEAPAGYQIADVTPDLSTVLLATYEEDRRAAEPRLVDGASNRVIMEFETDFAEGGFCLGGISRDVEIVWFFDCHGEGSFYSVDSGAEIENMRYQGSGAVFMPDGSTVVTVGPDQQLRFADLDMLRAGASHEEATIREIDAHDGFITSLSTNRDGTLLASAAREEPARVWDTATGKLLATIPYSLKPGPLASPEVLLHPLHARVLVASSGGVVLEYMLDTDELLVLANDRVSRSLTDAECQRFLGLDVCPDSSDG